MEFERNLRSHHKNLSDNMSICDIGVAVGIGAVSSLGAAAIGASASEHAANQAAAGQQASIDAQKQMFAQTNANLAPYRNLGNTSVGGLQGYPDFNFQPTNAQLSSTPGYQFALKQGLLANQNSASARGLGLSGAALKGADAFATGLADNTYQNQFNNALTNYNTNLGKRQFNVTTGENAAAQQGQIGASVGANIGQAYGAQGNDRAAGSAGVGKALTDGISGAYGAYQSAAQNNNFFSDPYAASVYGSSPGAISEPLNQFDFSASSTPDYSGMFAFGS